MIDLVRGTPRLERVEDLAFARQLLCDWSAPNPVQAAVRDRILVFLDEHPTDAHLRTCLAGHLTGSGLLVDANHERVLLTHHRKLEKWLQFGGHCDGDANLLATAWRETVEESGLTPVAYSASPIDVDVHAIPARGDEPEHWHLDVRYVFEAPTGIDPVISEESLDLAWFGPSELEGIAVDDSVARLFALVR